MRGIKTKALVLFLGLFLFYSGTAALADDHHWHGNRHSDHYYRNGHWYRHGWFGAEIAVPVLSTGVYVETLPPAYTPVVIHGTTYYYRDNTYFSPSTDGGYVVVSVPQS